MPCLLSLFPSVFYLPRHIYVLRWNSFEAGLVWGHVVWPNLSRLILLGRQRGRSARGGRAGLGLLSAVPRGPAAACTPTQPGAELSSSAASAAAGAAVAARGRAERPRCGLVLGIWLSCLPSGFFRNVRSLPSPRGKLPGGFAVF